MLALYKGCGFRKSYYMSVQTKTFASSSVIAWQWPLRVGVADSANHLKVELLQKKWPLQFTTVENISAPGKTDSHYNILILNQPAYSVGRKAITVTADTVFLFLKQDSPLLKVKSIDPEFLERTVKYYDASGIFLFSVDGISSWFSRFIVELSHNRNVIAALQSTVNVGYFFYDKRLEKQTTLSNVLDNTIKVLKRQPKRLKTILQINTRLTNERDFTPLQLSELLTHHKESFFYISESGDASSLHEIMQQLFKQIDPLSFMKEGRKKTPAKKAVKLASKQMGKYGTKKGSGGEWSEKLGRGLDINITGVSRDFKIRKLPDPDRPPPPWDDFSEMTGAEPREMTAGVEANPSKRSAKLPVKNGGHKKGKKEQLPTVPEPEAEHRYVQAKITNENNIVVQDYLKRNEDYTIQVYIGQTLTGFMHADGVIDTAEIFKDEKNIDETIQLIFRSNTSKTLQAAEIILPRHGNSTTADFTFSTTHFLQQFTGTISAFHKQRLIQEVEITSAISDDNVATTNHKIRMRVVASMRNNLTNLAGRTPFSGALIIDGNKNSNTSVHGIIDSKPIELTFSDAEQELVQKIKEQIEKAVINIKEGPVDLFDQDNVSLLRSLARKGYDLYHNYFRNTITTPGPLQIITNRQEFVPLDFMYTYPPPAKTAALCGHAKDALLSGSCKGCIDKNEIPASHICPFGFWCFSQVVERHSYLKRPFTGTADYSIVREPANAKNTLHILKNTLYASSARVETDETTGLRLKIATAIKNNCVQFYEANDWKQWSELSTKHNPDSLVLVVHIEENDEEESLEIGQDLSMEKIFMQGNVINATESSAPFIIIFGCESTNIKRYGFDVSNHLINSGAAIVISNLTKIRGRQAGPMVIKLVEFLKQQPLTDMSVGAIILKLRQSLLAEGSMVALTLSAQGDADWKINT